MKKVSIFSIILFSLLLTACGDKKEIELASANPVIYTAPEETETKEEIKVEEVLEQPIETTEYTEETEETTETIEAQEPSTLPNIEDYWDREDNYLDLMAYLHDCGVENIETDTLGVSEYPAVYYITVNGYVIHLYTSYGGQTPDVLFGTSIDDIIALYDFDRSEHQIMSTIVDKETNLTIQTESLEVLPELIQALKDATVDEIPNIPNYIYL